GGAELIGEHVDRAQGALGTVGGRVVAAVEVGGAPDEATAAQFVVFESLEVGVQAPRCGAFTQVDEGFHGVSRVEGVTELKVTLLFVLAGGKPPATRGIQEGPGG